MQELFHKRDLKDEKFEAVKAVLDDMVQKNEFIDSCEYVTKRVNENSGSTIQQTKVRQIMKNLGFKYRKVNHIAMSANSERSLVLRQQWAITLLKQKPENKTLINLDEVS